MDKKLFIKHLAQFLVGNQVSKSIALQLEQTQKSNILPNWASEWQKLRGSTPLFGYPTVEEAEEVLTKFLS